MVLFQQLGSSKDFSIFAKEWVTFIFITFLIYLNPQK